MQYDHRARFKSNMKPPWERGTWLLLFLVYSVRMNVVVVRMGCDIDSNNHLPDIHTYPHPNEFANAWLNRLCVYSCVNNGNTEILKKKRKNVLVINMK